MIFFLKRGPIDRPEPKDPNTLLLIHGSEIIDSSKYDVPLTNDGVVVSTDQSKFGNGSLYFNGDSRMFMPWNTILFGSDSFTIDWWERCTSSSTGARYCSSYNTLASGEGAGGLLLGYRGTRVYSSSEFKTDYQWDLIYNVTMLSVTTNAWVHWAFVRDNGSLKSYRNGVLFATTSLTGTIFQSEQYDMVIGGFRFGDLDPFIGYIEEFRISNVVRWTENFTPPSEPYR